MKESLTALLDHLRGAARFRWWALLAATAVCIAGWAAVMVWPNSYEANTRVFVDTRTALSPVIQGLAIQQDMAAHLNLAQETLVGENQILKVLRETGAAADLTSARDRAKAVQQVRDRIQLTLDKTGNPQEPGGVIYSISYRDRERERSLKVVEILLNSFIEDTLGGKRQSSEEASKFLANEISETEQRLRESEQGLAVFKKQNVGMMPGTEGDYFTRLQNEIDAERKARTDLGIALSRREELLKQLSGENPYSVTGGGLGPAGMASGSGRSGTDTSSQLAEAESRLAALLLRFTERHPDVIATQEEIVKLKARREGELEALRRGDAGAALASGATSNPIYQSIQLSLNQVNVQIAELRGEVGQHEVKIAELRRLINSVPEVEAEFSRLNRDYEVTKAQYTALVDRLKKAELGKDAEAASSVRFEVIDPPSAGFQPVAPNRPALVVLVFLAGLGAAGALAYVLNALRPVFSRQKELQEATGLPILGEVWHTAPVTLARAERRSLLALAGGVAGLCIAFGIALLISLTDFRG